MTGPLDADALVARRDEITAEIERLRIERDHLEALIVSMQALKRGTMRAGTYATALAYFTEQPGMSGTADEVYEWATANGWTTPARDRRGAIRTALSHLVKQGDLERLPGRPASYRAARRPLTSADGEGR